MNKKEYILTKLRSGLETSRLKRYTLDFPFEIYLGAYNGKMAMVVDGKANETIARNVSSTKLIDVMIHRIEIDKLRLVFTLENDKYESFFVSFCEDILDNVLNCDDEKLLDYVIYRWKQWIKLFASNSSKLLSSSQIKGLIGELFILSNYLAKKYSWHEAILGWGGIEQHHKDFEIQDTWYEIKTTSISSLKVTINSLFQLDSEIEGNLLVCRLENSTSQANRAFSLNDLVTTIRRDIINIQDLEEFDRKLCEYGYQLNEEYNSNYFIAKSIEKYTVNDEFPRIRMDELSLAIADVQYSLLLNKIESFKQGGNLLEFS